MFTSVCTVPYLSMALYILKSGNLKVVVKTYGNKRHYKVFLLFGDNLSSSDVSMSGI